MGKEHYTRNTVSVAAWCLKCQKQTQHRIDGVRKGPCLECIKKLDEQHAQPKKPEPEKQKGLFE
jgi:hypothetical protein